jgi:hypothetical protein
MNKIEENIRCFFFQILLLKRKYNRKQERKEGIKIFMTENYKKF